MPERNLSTTTEQRRGSTKADQVGEFFLSDCDKDDLLSRQTKSEHVMSKHQISKRRNEHVPKWSDYASEQQHSAASTKERNPPSIRRRLVTPAERQPSLGDTDNSSESRASNKHSHPKNTSASLITSSEEDDDDCDSSSSDYSSSFASFGDDHESSSFHDSYMASFVEDSVIENSIQRTRPCCLSRVKSADQARSFLKENDRPKFLSSPTTKSGEHLRTNSSIASLEEDIPIEGALNRTSVHRRRPRLAPHTKSADQEARSFKENDRSKPSPTESDERLHIASFAEDTPSEGASLRRTSVHRTRPRSSARTKSADQEARSFKENYRPKPSPTESDERLSIASLAEDTASEGALSRTSVHRTRPRVARTKSADQQARSFKESNRSKPSPTDSDERSRHGSSISSSPRSVEALNRTSGHRPRPRLSRTTSADHHFKQSEEGALNRTSGHRPLPRLSSTTSADGFCKKNERPKPPSCNNSDDCLRRPNSRENAAPPSSEEGALNRTSVHRPLPRLSRTTSADSFCKKNDEAKPPSRNNSDDFLRRINGAAGEDALPPSEGGALNRTSGHQPRPRVSRTTSAENDIPKQPGRTNSYESSKPRAGTTGEDAAPPTSSEGGGTLNRNSVHRSRPRLSSTKSADRLFKQQNDRQKPPLCRSTRSDEFLRRANAGGLGAHNLSPQTLRENIKEHYREDDLASASRSVVAFNDNASTMMSRRIQGIVGLDGVPPNANATFPKHVDEKFRKRQAVTSDRIPNEAKDIVQVQGGGLQVNGGSADTNSSIPNYGQDDDADDDQPHVKGPPGNSVISTSFQHLFKVMIGTKSNCTAKGGDLVKVMMEALSKEVNNGS